jgi:tryptophan synthase alpha chain
MNRLRAKFNELHAKGAKALIPYITPEFPFNGMALPLLEELEQAGADFVEIGIPFSDPLAEGETIQHSSDVALKNGVTIQKILDVASQFRKCSQLPLAWTGYIIPILRWSVDRFLSELRDLGSRRRHHSRSASWEASEFKGAQFRSSVGSGDSPLVRAHY